jgi:hypothetical protein
MPYVPTPTDIDALITQAEHTYNLQPGVLRALLMRESSLNPNATGPGGELGIGQFMPGTAAAFGIDPRDPTQAIPAAGLFLRQNLNRFSGDYDKAVAGYNWGPGNVAKFGLANMPASTRAYVGQILHGGSGAGGGGGSGRGAIANTPLVPATVPPPPASAPQPAPDPATVPPGPNGVPFVPPPFPEAMNFGGGSSLADVFMQAAKNVQSGNPQRNQFMFG